VPWRHDTAPSRAVVRREDRSSLDIRGGVRWERLTPTPLDGIEFLELVYSPGAESDRQPYRHPGVELVLVTQGVMTIFLGFDRLELRPGDSVAFPSSTPHRYVYFTDGETRATTVILRDDLSHLQIRERAEAPDAFGEGRAAGEATSA
jgi:quercetin dioxygenase-like cupin family protein